MQIYFPIFNVYIYKLTQSQGHMYDMSGRSLAAVKSMNSVDLG
jgi:hypothetical protein